MHYRFLRYPGGKAKAVTFSYDDGCRDDVRLAKTLTEQGIRCTFNLNSGLFGKDDKDWHLTPEEIREYILDAGHEIAVHGRMHMAPGLSRPVDCIQDVLNCRLELEKTFRPHIQTEGIPFIEEGRRWQYQMHIYESPFYYIDYCLAQTAAFGFLLASLEDYDGAYGRYIRLMKQGGEAYYENLLEEALIPSPFQEGSLQALADKIEALLLKIKAEM